ncbi:MAG: hypothetical protein AAGE01_21145 [Pseudomonadota bacterium]
MLNVRHLARIGLEGLRDLIPAGLAFFEDPEERALLDRVFGTASLLRLVALGAAASLLGQLFARFGPGFPLKQEIDWGTAVLAILLGLLIRRHLYLQGHPNHDVPFRALALSLVPALAAMLLTTMIVELSFGHPFGLYDDYFQGSVLGDVLLWSTHLLGLAAAAVIAVAALCYSERWMEAATDLAVRLLVFKILVWVTALVLIEIGILGPILAAIIETLTGIQIPEWVGNLVDQLSYALLLMIAYGFIIGGTWLVCRRTYDELMTNRSVNLTRALEELAKPEPKKEKAA